MISKKTYRRWHKWLGVGFGFFLLLFALSGLVLNHRHSFGNMDLSRQWLPAGYQFSNWNNGLLRGTLRLSADSILVYGAGGVWLTDAHGQRFADYTAGMGSGADARTIRNVVRTKRGELFACAPFDAYQWREGSWRRLAVGHASTLHPTRFSDVTTRGDSVVFVGRDSLYVATPPYSHFQGVELHAPAGYTNKVSLFRTLWLVHSGEIGGLMGKLIVDLVALLLAFLCLSGFVIWLLPKWIRRRRNKGLWQKGLRWHFRWHDRWGRYALPLLVFITLTGFALRPPLLLAVVRIATPPIPGSLLDSPNPWQDKLRALRWDANRSDWLLSTSDGFYSLTDFRHQPVREAQAPAVSVMGINVLTLSADQQSWIVGSFAGLYYWHRGSGKAYDYFTHAPAPTRPASPFGQTAVSGFSSDFGDDIVCTYDHGTDALRQPSWMARLPISLWQLALEVHTGRIYTFLGPVRLIYFFFASLLTLAILWSGWAIRKRKQGKKDMLGRCGEGC